MFIYTHIYIHIYTYMYIYIYVYKYIYLGQLGTVNVEARKLMMAIVEC